MRRARRELTLAELEELEGAQNRARVLSKRKTFQIVGHEPLASYVWALSLNGHKLLTMARRLLEVDAIAPVPKKKASKRHG